MIAAPVDEKRYHRAPAVIHAAPAVVQHLPVIAASAANVEFMSLAPPSHKPGVCGRCALYDTCHVSGNGSRVARKVLWQPPEQWLEPGTPEDFGS